MCAVAPSVVYAASPGSLDPLFGTDGKVITSAASGFLDDLTVQADGSIVATGQGLGSNPDFLTVRYTSNGSLDPTFGSSGLVRTDFGGGSDAAQAVVVQTDGKIVVAGTGFAPVFVGNRIRDFALARYNPDGSLDAQFGNGGTLTTDIMGEDIAFAVAQQDDGKLVAAGDRAIARYNPDGSLDTTFSGDGKLAFETIGIRAMQIQPDGKMVLGGSGRFTGKYALARLNADGSPDVGFGTNGVATNDLRGNAVALALQSDGKILLGGHGNETSFDSDFALTRWNSDGSVDTSFSADGQTFIEFGNGTGGEQINDLHIQDDGKILAAGYAATLQTGSATFALARYLPDGSLDAAFGDDGTLTTRFLGLSFAAAVAIQTDGRIIAGGYTANSNGFNDAVFAVSRYIASSDTVPPVVVGTADRSANTNGWYNADVTIGWMAADPDPSSGPPSDPVDTVASTEGSDVLYTSEPSCDPAGNCATGSLRLSIDKTLPTATVTSPADGAALKIGSAVSADYVCADEVDGSGLASCVGDIPTGGSIETTSVGQKAFTVAARDDADNAISLTHGYSVVYDFHGFFDPVDNLPTLNSVNAGRAIPVKFSLSGDYGLEILAATYPRSEQIACSSTAPVDGIEETLTAGGSSLSYAVGADRYTFVWKTDKGWANTCRQLVVKLADGQSYRANFKLK